SSRTRRRTRDWAWAARATPPGPSRARRATGSPPRAPTRGSAAARSRTSSALSEALALLEVSSLARGVVVADAVAKRARIELLQCGPVSPGKYLVLFAGGVGEVDESFAAGVAA